MKHPGDSPAGCTTHTRSDWHEPRVTLSLIQVYGRELDLGSKEPLESSVLCSMPSPSLSNLGMLTSFVPQHWRGVRIHGSTNDRAAQPSPCYLPTPVWGGGGAGGGACHPPDTLERCADHAERIYIVFIYINYIYNTHHFPQYTI